LTIYKFLIGLEFKVSLMAFGKRAITLYRKSRQGSKILLNLLLRIWI